MTTPVTQARVRYVQALRETADTAYDLAVHAGDLHLPGQLIYKTRQLRLAQITPVDLAVLVELLSGTSWEDVARAMNLPEAEVRRTYGEAFTAWSNAASVELGDDAAALDSWVARHAEPWEDPAEHPVSRMLAD